MIHEHFPEQFRGVDRLIPELKKKAVERADHLIAISESTRDDLISYLGVAAEKITVIPLGSSFAAPLPSAVAKSQGRPYLLYVGLRGGVKNFSRFLRAFSQSTLFRSGFEIVAVGGGELTTEEKSLARRLRVESCVHQVQADDQQLARLYSQAALFVYPSLYEGFGLPLVEAMRCGCPVACSHTGSMAEIAGDAARYFDPEDEGEMQTVMESIVQSIPLCQTLRQRGYEREKRFSWESCVARTAELYRLVLRQRG